MFEEEITNDLWSGITEDGAAGAKKYIAIVKHKFLNEKHFLIVGIVDISLVCHHNMNVHSESSRCKLTAGLSQKVPLYSVFRVDH